MTNPIDTIAVIGAGAWGTALAVAAQRAGRRVVMQAHEPEVVAAINDDHANPLYLSGIDLHPDIRAVQDPGAAVDGADAALLVVPSQFLRGVARTLAANAPTRLPLVICAKGIEQGTGALMSEVAEQELADHPIAALSGPTFAIEVARDLPTAVTLACDDAAIGERLVSALGTARFRTYLSDDVIGAEVGGAVKNVLAIACGIVEGRGLGDNARAALITRGLAEMVRLAVAKGGRRETLMGLCGLGDLTLTCNAMQSRNFSLGVAIGQGRTLAEIEAERRSVAEGVPNSASVAALAAQLGIDMPIAAAVDAILQHGGGIDETIAGLLGRPLTREL